MQARVMYTIWAFAVTVVFFAAFASAVTQMDGTDDLLHGEWDENTNSYSWGYTDTDNPNIDITEISCTVEDENHQVTLIMEVDGYIELSQYFKYRVFCNTSDAEYVMEFKGDAGFCRGTLTSDKNQVSYGDISFLENGLQGTVNLVGNGTTIVNCSGWAAENIPVEGKPDEFLQDWVPETGVPGLGDNEEDDGIPGFEMIFLIGAVAIALALRRKKN